MVERLERTASLSRRPRSVGAEVILQSPVSDLGTLGGLTQFPRRPFSCAPTDSMQTRSGASDTVLTQNGFSLLRSLAFARHPFALTRLDPYLPATPVTARNLGPERLTALTCFRPEVLEGKLDPLALLSSGGKLHAQRGVSFALAFLMLSLGSSANAQEALTIDIPGATFTRIIGLNAQGDIIVSSASAAAGVSRKLPAASCDASNRSTSRRSAVSPPQVRAKNAARASGGNARAPSNAARNRVHSSGRRLMAREVA